MRATRLTYRVGGATLVDDVSLDVRAGEVLGILGPNGAGKSTLLRLLSGELSASQGGVFYGREDLRLMPARALARARAVVSQQSSLAFSFSAFEVVLLGASVPGLAAEGAATGSAWEALERVALTAKAQRSYTSLSGGERQRVHIARAFCQLDLARRTGVREPVLMLDEPTSSLDIGHQRLVLDAVQREAERGTAVVAVLHDLNLAAAYCDRLLLMREGRIAAEGAPAEVIESEGLSFSYGCPITANALPRAGVPFVLPVTG